jgi:predicted TIM-barrel fold metal-dependent hydrolase
MIKNTCPKCNSNDIIRIPGQIGAHGSGNNIIMGATIFSSIPVTRFVCGHCGFSEEWIDDRNNIEKLKKKYGAGSK